MSNKTDIGGKVPKLRFPEFRDESEWEEKTLGRIASFYKGKGISKADVEQNGNTPCIRYGELYTKYTEVISVVESRTNLPVDELFLSKKNDVLIPSSGETKLDIATASCLELDDVALGGDINVLRSKQNGIFLSYYLNAKKKYQIAKIAQGDTVVHLYYSQLKGIQVETPKPKEQQKIAGFLSSVDELIAAQTQKLDALKAHKKGLMQQLFPAEGETVPKLRFPEFRDAPKWEEKKAATLFINRTEGGEAGLPIYSVTMNDGMIKRSLLDRHFDDIAEPEGNKKAYKNDIAYNMMRMWQGAFGVVTEDCMVSPAYVILAPRDGVYSEFFGYLLKLQRYLRLLTSHSQGLTSDRLRLYYKDFARIPLSLPAFPEQQKIADCLSSIDDLLTAQTQKIEALKAHKRGLMQQLFPAVEEENR